MCLMLLYPVNGTLTRMYPPDRPDRRLPCAPSLPPSLLPCRLACQPSCIRRPERQTLSNTQARPVPADSLNSAAGHRSVAVS